MQKISIRLSEKTLSTLCEKYNLSNNKVPSSIIRKCLDDAINTQTLAGGKKHRRLSPQETLRIVRATKLDNSSLYSLRISTGILEYLKKYYDTTNTSECIRCALYDCLNNTGKELVIKNNKKLFFMLGQKNSQMLDWLNPIFNEATSAYNLTGYLEPFTGTANVILHTDNWKSETINDFSYDLINLHHVIKKYPVELKVCLSHPNVTSDIKTSFQNSRNFLDNTPIPKRRNKKFEIERATAFFICRYYSYYGDGTSINVKKDINRYLINIDYVYAFSKRLQNTEIKRADAIYRLNTFNYKSKHLIYIDAPYINTEHYYKINQSNKKCSVFFNHTTLRNVVEKLRKDNVCLLSYRITASSSALKKNKDAEKFIRANLDKLYLKRKYFYALNKLKNGQVEIILSTHFLSGFEEYNTSLIEKEVA